MFLCRKLTLFSSRAGGHVRFGLKSFRSWAIKHSGAGPWKWRTDVDGGFFKALSFFFFFSRTKMCGLYVRFSPPHPKTPPHPPRMSMECSDFIHPQRSSQKSPTNSSKVPGFQDSFCRTEEPRVLAGRAVLDKETVTILGNPNFSDTQTPQPP